MDDLGMMLPWSVGPLILELFLGWMDKASPSVDGGDRCRNPWKGHSCWDVNHNGWWPRVV
jgi:hypothetical protein